MTDLVATNETRERKKVQYSVENLVTGEILKKGSFNIEADGILRIERLPELKNSFYLIRWTDGTSEGVNHFTTTIGDDWTWEKYAECLKKAGFYDEFEGF